jgi:ubiquitin carboxyl-terminal hydrolase 10
VVPALPKASPKETKPAASAEQSPAPTAPEPQPESSTGPATEGETAAPEAETTEGPPAPAWSKPKLWTGLFSKPGASAASTSAAATAAQAQTNGNAAEGSAAVPATGGFAKTNASSLAQALQAYRPITPDKLAFLEPRGLVNTGNMCYMNSVSPRAAWRIKSAL